MSELNFSPHAIIRMSQRGLTADDIGLIMQLGTEVEGGYLVLERDYRAFERMVKQMLERARKLAGKRVVVKADKVVTAYHATSEELQRLVKSVQQRDLCNGGN